MLFHLKGQACSLRLRLNVTLLTNCTYQLNMALHWKLRYTADQIAMTNQLIKIFDDLHGACAKQCNKADLYCYSTDLLVCSILRRRILDETKTPASKVKDSPCMLQCRNKHQENDLPMCWLRLNLIVTVYVLTIFFKMTNQLIKKF